MAESLHMHGSWTRCEVEATVAGYLDILEVELVREQVDATELDVPTIEDILDREAADAWLDRRLLELRGKTPLAILKRGNLDRVVTGRAILGVRGRVVLGPLRVEVGSLPSGSSDREVGGWVDFAARRS